jgi:hypothetical protein
MAKLSREQVIKEVKAKGCGLVDMSNYQNMLSIITIQCGRGHTIETNLDTLRKPSFRCPTCEGAEFKLDIPKQIPEKSGFRVVGFDQATEHIGVSVYDAGKLVFYDYFHFTGDLATRLVKIRSLIEDIVIVQ